MEYYTIVIGVFLAAVSFLGLWMLAAKLRTPSWLSFTLACAFVLSQGLIILGVYESAFHPFRKIAHPMNGDPPPADDSAGFIDRDPRVRGILFASNRGPSEKPADTDTGGELGGFSLNWFQGGREKELIYGVAPVRIPEAHKFGKVERPENFIVLGFTIWKEKEKKEEHFTLGNIDIFEKELFEHLIKKHGSDGAMIFVHGFNNSFSDSIFKLAQIVWDTQFSGVPIAFSWPSKAGGALYYDYDRESALFSRDAFLDVLESASRNASKVYVIAHSMGNQIVVDALAKASERGLGFQLSEVILAAPDVDKDVFESLADRLRKAAKGITLYASSSDKALLASKAKAGWKPRAGDIPPDGPLVLPGIDTIDVTAVGDDMFALNHGTFSSSRSVIDDLGRLINSGIRPPHRRSPQIRRVPELPNQPRYWRFPN